MAAPVQRTSKYAARYRAARAYADLSQGELAEKLGVDAQTIKRRENGKQDPKLAERIAVASVCGVPAGFMENGWGALEPDEIRELLAQQSAILAELRTLLSGEDGDLLPAIYEILGRRPPRDQSDPSQGSPPPDDAET